MLVTVPSTRAMCGVVKTSSEGMFGLQTIPFFAVEKFEATLQETHTEPKTLVLRLRRVPFLDATGLHTLREVTQELSGRKVTVILCEANALVLAKVKAAGIFADEGGARYADTLEQALSTSTGIGRATSLG